VRVLATFEQLYRISLAFGEILSLGGGELRSEQQQHQEDAEKTDV